MCFVIYICFLFIFSLNLFLGSTCSILLSIALNATCSFLIFFVNVIVSISYVNTSITKFKVKSHLTCSIDVEYSWNYDTTSVCGSFFWNQYSSNLWKVYNVERNSYKLKLWWKLKNPTTRLVGFHAFPKCITVLNKYPIPKTRSINQCACYSPKWSKNAQKYLKFTNITSADK